MYKNIYIFLKIISVFILVVFLKLYYNKEYFNNIKYFHNETIIVNKHTYSYVYNYKKQLLYNISNLLTTLNIKFVISHGNLLEYTRDKLIYHDDDLDIRLNISDKEKWSDYCKNNSRESQKYNLIFDHRFKNIEKQLYNGIQARLLKFNNPNNIPEIKMDIHLDLVFNKVKLKKIWKDYSIDYNNLRKVKYLGINTFAPNLKDTHLVLKKEYSKKYIKPNYKPYNLS